MTDSEVKIKVDAPEEKLARACKSKIDSLDRAHRRAKICYYWSFILSGILNTISTILAGANTFADTKTFALPVFLLTGGSTLLTAVLALTDAQVFKEYLVCRRKFVNVQSMILENMDKAEIQNCWDKFERADKECLKVYATVFYKDL